MLRESVDRYTELMAPSDDFRSTVDTSRMTKALYIVDSSNVAATLRNEVTGQDVTVRVGGQFYPFRVKSAVTVSGHDVIYIY